MKKKQKTQEQVSNGFENLIEVHTRALEENSLMIAEMLQAIADKSKDKPLSKPYMNSLKKLERELKAMNKDLDDLGDY